MASSTPIYKAYVGVIPTAKGFGKNLEGELSGANLQGAADKVGGRAGRSLGSRLTGAFKSALKIGAVITAAVGAATVGGGISRQLNIEDAQKKLEGLGHTTKDIENIMTSALDSVKGTSYGLDTAATQAATAVAAGVKPGKDLTNYLKLTADAATIAGVSMDEMGFVMNKVQTGQRAYTEDLNMLADRGIPIFQWLQEEYGVTAEELKKMVSDGKVDSETYFRVIEENIGGAALKSGETTRGAFKNMLAAMSRTGVAMTEGFFPLIRESFVGITDVFDAVTPKLTEVFSPMWEVLQPLFSSAIGEMSGGLASWIENLNVKPLSDFFLGIATSLKVFVDEWKTGDGVVTMSGWLGVVQSAAIGMRGVWDEVTGGIKAFGSAWEANDGKVTGSGFVGFMEKAAFWVRDLWEQIKALDFSSLSGFFDSLTEMDIDLSGLSGIGSGIGPIIKSVADSFLLIAKSSPRLLALALELLADALGFIANHADVLVKLLPYIVAGFLAYKSAVTAANLAMQTNMALDIASLPLQIKRNITSMQAAEARLLAANATKAQTLADAQQTTATLRGTIATKARTVAEKASTVAKKAGAVASRVLGAAIKFATGPIGLIIIGITALVAGLIWFFTQTELGQAIWEKAWTAIKDAAGAVADWFMSTVVPILQSAWESIVEGALWVYDNVILKVWHGIQVAIDVVVKAVMAYVQMLVFYWQNVLAPVALWLYNNIIKPVWEGIKIAIAVVVTAVIVYVKLLVWYWQNVIAPVAKWLYKSVILPVWNAIKKAIKATIDWFTNTGWPILKKAWDAVASSAKWLYEKVIKPVWNAIKLAIKVTVDWFKNTAWPTFQNVINLLRTKFEQFKLGLKIIWSYIKASVIQPVVNWFQNTVKPLFDRVVDAIRNKFDSFKNALKRIWNFIKNNIINPVVTWFRDTVKPIFDKVLGTLEDSFENTKNNIGKIWDKLKDKVKAPVEVVVNKVVKPVADTYDKVAGVIGAKKINMSKTSFDFWRGGMLPGYTPGKDIFGFVDPVNGIRLNLSGGEPIMRPEFGRVMGKDWIDSVNAAARSGGVSGVKKSLGFATGGVFPGGEYSAAGGACNWVKKKASGAKDWLTEAWDTLTDFIDDPKKAFNSVKDGLLETAGIPSSDCGKLLSKSVTNLTDGIIEKVTNFGGVDSEGTGTVAGAPPQQGSKLTSLSQILGLPRFGTVVTSTTRRGARTAGSGSVSLHAQGKAADFGGSAGAMRNFFNYVRNNYRASELIHTPMGGRQLSRGGIPRANFRPVTARMHYNHVHVGAFKDGGIFGGVNARLMDNGGYLMPGVNNIVNKTGGYETVIPREESRFLREMATGKTAAGGTQVFYQNTVHAETDKAKELVDELMWEQKKAERKKRGRYSRTGG